MKSNQIRMKSELPNLNKYNSNYKDVYIKMK